MLLELISIIFWKRRKENRNVGVRGCVYRCVWCVSVRVWMRGVCVGVHGERACVCVFGATLYWYKEIPLL